MDTKKLQNQIAELEAQIEALPKGSVAKKSVNGKTYYYHRYNENGKRTEKYIDFDSVDALRGRPCKRACRYSPLDYQGLSAFCHSQNPKP